MKEMVLFLVGLPIGVTILCLSVRFLSLQEGPSKKMMYLLSSFSLALACQGAVIVALL